jgi:murein DD-endopeptidase MepM/ murein hydrolase activator NlpD
MRVSPGSAAVVLTLVALGIDPTSAWQRAPGLAVTVDARSIQPGELVLLTVVTPDPTDVMAVHAFGHRVPAYRVDRTTWRTLVGIDLTSPPGRYAVTFAATVAGQRLETTSTLDVRDKAFPTRELSVAEAFVNPPATETARITAEAARLDAIWKVETPQRLWEGPFVRPVAEPANSAFGSRSVFNGQIRAPHSGADFLSPAGTPVHAPASGKVVVAAPLYYTGNTVVIDHGLGLYSLFAHFSAIAVHEGDLVTAGDVVGRVGATGRVTGPHLHWAIRVGGARVDPLSVLAVLGADPKGGSEARRLGGRR